MRQPHRHFSLSRKLKRYTAILLAALLAGSALAGLSDIPAQLVEAMSKRFGPDVPSHLAAWRRHLLHRDVSEEARLANSNRFFNAIPYQRDSDHWKVDDYWATPVETVSSQGADCEDYAIGKYFSLKERGIAVEKLRIAYVRHLRLNEAHMVLVYYPQPDAEPLVLDNTDRELKPASQRPDLVPVYSFNDDDVWTEKSGSRSIGSPRQIRLWSGLLTRMRREYGE
jgi:predicted transglutaminase-like cysteine proteinase